MATAGTVTWAQQIVRHAWALERPGDELDASTELAVLSVARHESPSFGTSSHNNWGGIKCPAGAALPGPADLWSNCFAAKDDCGEGLCAFRAYDTPTAGARDFLRVLLRTSAVREALRSGEASRIADAMKRAGYFTAPTSSYASGIVASSKVVADELELGAGLRRRASGWWIASGLVVATVGVGAIALLEAGELAGLARRVRRGLGGVLRPLRVG